MRSALLAVLIACGDSSQPAGSTTKPAAQPAKRADAMLATSDAATAEADSDDDHGHEQCEQRAEQIVSSPPLPDAADERELVVGLRRVTIHKACEDGWATGPLADRLVAIDELAERITATRKKPSTIGCARVVASHYADATWRAKLDGFSAAERNGMIARSRERMAKACAAESWSELLRACLVAGGGEMCFERSGQRLSWGHPAAGTVTSLGIADCTSYGEALAKIATCTKLSAAARDALRRSYDEMQAHLAGLPAAERGKLASGCRAGRDAIQRAAASAGC